MDIRIINESAEDFGNVLLKMECSPDFSKGFEVEINLSPNARIEINTADVEVKGDYLANITERVAGSLLFSVIGKSSGFATIGTSERNLFNSFV